MKNIIIGSLITLQLVANLIFTYGFVLDNTRIKLICNKIDSVSEIVLSQNIKYKDWNDVMIEGLKGFDLNNKNHSDYILAHELKLRQIWEIMELPSEEAPSRPEIFREMRESKAKSIDSSLSAS
jgi:hypothetical protein